jgi:ASC-1-like (ASCH) protein
MRLHPEPFALIKSGVKKVECRLCDEKRQELKVGNMIEFQLRPDFFEKFGRKIIAIHTFTTFEALFVAFPEERVNDVYQYYTPEEEKQFGVVAIELS